MKNKIIYLPLDVYLQYLEDKKPFAFSRWGDGEWSAILGIEGQNCDGHEYYPQLGKDLKTVLLSREGFDYFFGLLPCAYNIFPKAVPGFSEKFGLKWVDGNVFMHANRDGKLGKFWRLLRCYKIMWVGPPGVLSIIETKGFVEYACTYTVPLKNAYRFIESIREKLITIIKEQEINLVIFTAGMMSKVLIDDLWRHFDGGVTLIDLGSMMDGYTGKVTRKYQAHYDWNSLAAYNRP